MPERRVQTSAQRPRRKPAALGPEWFAFEASISGLHLEQLEDEIAAKSGSQVPHERQRAEYLRDRLAHARRAHAEGNDEALTAWLELLVFLTRREPWLLKWAKIGFKVEPGNRRQAAELEKVRRAKRDRRIARFQDLRKAHPAWSLESVYAAIARENKEKPEAVKKFILKRLREDASKK